jgi:hypothetical protein
MFAIILWLNLAGKRWVFSDRTRFLAVLNQCIGMYKGPLVQPADVSQLTDLSYRSVRCSPVSPSLFQRTAYFTEGLSSAFRSPSAY